jgi:hypothetical protein
VNEVQEDNLIDRVNTEIPELNDGLSRSLYAHEASPPKHGSQAPTMQVAAARSLAFVRSNTFANSGL